jgi:very-short-patch-repair endonuclease
MKTDEGVSANRRGRARAMRRTPTDAERRPWSPLRDRPLSGLKFRTQAPVGPYIVDFLCFGARLIVEADGSRHAENVRDAYLSDQGWKVLRFWIRDVLRNRASVLDTIVAQASPGEVTPHPAGFAGHLLPEGEGDPHP